MGIREQRSYLKLKSAIKEAKTNKTNLLIVTLPGTGMGRFLKEFEADDNLSRGVSILNYDWKNSDEVLKMIDERFLGIGAEEKVVLTINYPGLLENKLLTTKAWWNHFYKRYYFGVREREEGIELVKEFNLGLSSKKAEQIYNLSGGLVQIMKYLAINGVEAREGLESVLESIVTAVLETSDEIRQKLDLKISGTVLEEYLIGKEWPMKIDFELNLIEDGKIKGKLTLVEAKILGKMMKSEGKISKEEVSEIKWGEGKYDEFSDQAINKAMRRLNDKLEVGKIVTVPKVGYSLHKK